MENFKVPRRVKNKLDVDEEILAVHRGVDGFYFINYVDLYATNQRLHKFTRAWWLWEVLGLFSLLVRRRHKVTAYSEITGITYKSYRPKFYLIITSIIGLVLIYLGIALSIADSNVWALGVCCGGLFFFAMGFFFKKSQYIIEINNPNGKNRKWYINRIPFGGKIKKQLDDFISDIKSRAGIQ